MPSSYTDAVQNGTITTLPEYAISCARAFGALISMRDDSSDAPIPEKFEPETGYHDRAIAEAKDRLAELQAMDAAQIIVACAAAIDTEGRRRAAKVAENIVKAGRYRAMIEKVEAWTPPTTEHVELKKFMLNQLKQSLDFDCAPVRGAELVPTAEAWHATEIKDAAWSYHYHIEERRKEIERAEGRNRWVAALRSSLAEPAT